MNSDLYSTLAWRIASARARQRDGDRCTVARLIGGSCSDLLHVHHLVPVSAGGAALDLDNLATVCSRHHPMLEAMRREIVTRREPRRCPHHHPYEEGRLLCEARLNRR